MPWPKTGATQYHAQIRLPNKGRTIKERRDLERLYLLNSVALGCYQPFPEVLIVLSELYVGNW